MDLGAFGGLAGFGILLASLGFAYAQFKTGAGKAKDELINTLKETATAEKAKAESLASEKMMLIASHQTQINALNLQIGELKGALKVTEGKVKEYTDLFQGRDPQQQRFMEIVLKQIEEGQKQTPAVQEYMTRTTSILSEIQTFMKNLNESTQHTNTFVKAVEKSTTQAGGKALTL